MRRAQSLPTSAEPVEPYGDAEACSPPPPYSAPAVQSYNAGNGYGRFNNSHGQGSRNIYKQPSIPEMSNQDNPEVLLTEGKANLILTSPLRINQVLTTVGGQVNRVHQHSDSC